MGRRNPMTPGYSALYFPSLLGVGRVRARESMHFFKSSYQTVFHMDLHSNIA